MSTKIGRKIARPTQSPEQVVAPVSSGVFQEKYPALFDFLSKVRETANFHKTGSMTMFWEDGCFKLSINDRPEFRSTFVTSESLGTAFLIADRGLRSRSLRWRKNKHRSNLAQ